MTANQPAVTVQEVSMQEWAMLAFHAARAPQRVRVTVNTAEADDDYALLCPRIGFWFLMAVVIAAMAWWLI